MTWRPNFYEKGLRVKVAALFCEQYGHTSPNGPSRLPSEKRRLKNEVQHLVGKQPKVQCARHRER